MYENQLYASGVYGVLIADWRLRCETPLAIRNGIKVAYQVVDQNKSRGMDTSFHWRTPDKAKGDREVTALHYGYEVSGGKVQAVSFIPPSSVRGALRSWTINHLIHPNYRSKMSPPSKEDPAKTEVYLAAVRQALASPDSGYHWIASLFGLAFDTRVEEADLSNAGRLHVSTERFSQAAPQPIAVNGTLKDGMAGPTNARRQMTVRNPLDHITHASKEGGLHHFLEFCKGEEFKIHLTVLNPQASDLGLISLWKRELDSGMLRLGALSSIGRGRVSVIDEGYQVWLGPGAPASMRREEMIPAEDPAAEEALSGLWDPYLLPADRLEQFINVLQEVS